MEKLSYQLRIEVEDKFYDRVSTILGLQPKDYKFGWSYEMIGEEEGQYYNLILRFLDILNGKYEELREIGVQNHNLSIWIEYGYNNQCNMEFDPETLYRIGNNGIRLCISCYEAGSDDD